MLNDALSIACLNGQLDVAKNLIYKGADDFNAALLCACRRYGHMYMVQFLIDQGADDFDNGLYEASCNGHIHIVIKMIEHGAIKLINALFGACVHGHLIIARLLMDHGANDYNSGLRGACIGGQLEMIYEMIESGANDWSILMMCVTIHDTKFNAICTWLLDFIIRRKSFYLSHLALPCVDRFIDLLDWDDQRFDSLAIRYLMDLNRGFRKALLVRHNSQRQIIWCFKPPELARIIARYI